MEVYHTSRWVVSPGYALGVFLAGYGFFAPEGLKLLLVGVGVFALIVSEVLSWRSRLIVSPENVTYREGFLSVKTRRIEYAGITDVELNQSLIGRVLGFGTLDIDTPATGGVEITCKHFSRTDHLEKELRKHQTAARSGGVVSPGQPRTRYAQKQPAPQPQQQPPQPQRRQQ